MNKVIEVSCIYHPYYLITNYCTDPQCNLPLCPDCIQIHLNEHRQRGNFGDFQNIDVIVEKSRDSVCQMKQQISEKRLAASRLFEENKLLLSSISDQLQYYKKTIIELVNQQFERIEENNRSVLAQFQSQKQSELEDILVNYDAHEKMLNEYLEGFSLKEKCLKY